MKDSATHAAIEAVARHSYGRLIAYLASRTHDVAGAEDALSDAFTAALERWPLDGIPQKREAWLLHAARNRMIDAARRRQVRQDSERFLLQLTKEAEDVAATHEHFPDERLKLLFVCAHPAIDTRTHAPDVANRAGRGRRAHRFGLFGFAHSDETTAVWCKSQNSRCSHSLSRARSTGVG